MNQPLTVNQHIKNLMNMEVKDIERPNPCISNPSAIIYAIGDLEGQVQMLMQWLLQKNLVKIVTANGMRNEEAWIWNNNDHPNVYVVQVGDQIDSIRITSGDAQRNNYDLLVPIYMDYLQTISNGKVMSVMGNHELLNLDFNFDYASYRDLNMINSSTLSNKKNRINLFNCKGLLYKIMCRRNVILKINNSIFSHAGLRQIDVDYFKSIHSEPEMKTDSFQSESQVNDFIIKINNICDIKKLCPLDLANGTMERNDELLRQLAVIPDFNGKPSTYGFLWHRDYEDKTITMYNQGIVPRSLNEHIKVNVFGHNKLYFDSIQIYKSIDNNISIEKNPEAFIDKNKKEECMALNVDIIKTKDGVLGYNYILLGIGLIEYGTNANQVKASKCSINTLQFSDINWTPPIDQIISILDSYLKDNYDEQYTEKVIQARSRIDVNETKKMICILYLKFDNNNNVIDLFPMTIINNNPDEYIYEYRDNPMRLRRNYSLIELLEKYDIAANNYMQNDENLDNFILNHPCLIAQYTFNNNDASIELVTTDDTIEKEIYNENTNIYHLPIPFSQTNNDIVDIINSKIQQITERKFQQTTEVNVNYDFQNSIRRGGWKEGLGLIDSLDEEQKQLKSKIENNFAEYVKHVVKSSRQSLPPPPLQHPSPGSVQPAPQPTPLQQLPLSLHPQQHLAPIPVQPAPPSPSPSPHQQPTQQLSLSPHQHPPQQQQPPQHTAPISVQPAPPSPSPSPHQQSLQNPPQQPPSLPDEHLATKQPFITRQPTDVSPSVHPGSSNSHLTQSTQSTLHINDGDYDLRYEFAEMLNNYKTKEKEQKIRWLDLFELKRKFENVWLANNSKVHINKWHVFNTGVYLDIIDKNDIIDETEAMKRSEMILNVFKMQALVDVKRSLKGLISDLDKIYMKFKDINDYKIDELDKFTFELKTIMKKWFIMPFSFSIIQKSDVDRYLNLNSDQKKDLYDILNSYADGSMMGGGGEQEKRMSSDAKEDGTMFDEKQEVAELLKQYEIKIGRFENEYRHLGYGRNFSKDTINVFRERISKLAKVVDDFYLEGKYEEIIASSQKSHYPQPEPEKEKNIKSLDKTPFQQKKALSGQKLNVFLFGMFKSDVYILYLFKLIRFGGQVLAINWAQQIFENKYIDETHGIKRTHDPSPLSHMLYMFLSIDATIEMVLFVLIITVYGLYSEHGSSFRLDKDTISGILKDALLSSIFLLVTGEIIAHFLKKKKYFGYKMQGGATIRAFSEMIFALCITSTILPFTVFFI